MKYLLVAFTVLAGFALSSCEELTDLEDPASVRKARDRSEYILLCTPKEKDDGLAYTLREVLHAKPGVSVPWGVGDVVAAPMIDGSAPGEIPGQAVIFYEDFGGKSRPMELHLFYTSSSEDDASRLEGLLENIQR